MPEALATPATIASTDPALVEDVMRFHGHTCPGANLGIRVSDVVLELLGRHSAANQLIAVVETSLCAVDPIQYLTCCTLGKRNLILHDHGKHTYTFWKRSDGSGVRILTQPDGLAVRNPELWEIHERIHKGVATEAERDHFETMQSARGQQILAVDVNELLRIESVEEPPPGRADQLGPVLCAQCGEPTLGTHLQAVDGQDVCIPCARAVSRELADLSAPTA